VDSTVGFIGERNRKKIKERFMILAESFGHSLFHFMFAMASNQMARFHGFKQRFFDQTTINSKGAAGVESAARRWIGGAGYIAAQNDALLLMRNIWNRDRGHQRMGIGMYRF
jgi:hypothetical protein